MRPVDIDKAIKTLLFLARYAYKRGYVSSKGGNLSYRISHDILIKKSGTSLRSIKPRDFILVRNFPSKSKVDGASIDYLIHREIYLNTNGKIVLHCHPHEIIKYTLKHEEAEVIYPVDLEGGYYLSKGIPVVKGDHADIYHEIGRKSLDYKIIIESGHGIYVWGTDPNEVINLLELAISIVNLQL